MEFVDWYLRFTKQMSLIFLFVDGVGLGDEVDHNPFFSNSYKAFRRLTGGQSFSKKAEKILQDQHLFRPVDATLGIEGLPQSGTGQTTLFTGKNASQLISKHFGPFPTRVLNIC